ncbi:MAG: C45 family autoproteolytic acyltransferase/hydrolase [Gaiellales bacterium]
MATLPTIIIECGGDGRTRGHAQGEELRRQIADVHERWEEHTALSTGLHPDAYIERLLADTDFVPAIARHTPELLEEARGIAEGSGLTLDAILAHNLMDEQWWHQTELAAGHACSLLAIPADGERPALVAQNMDLPAWMDGAQAVVRHHTPDGETVVLTAAGMVGLTGANSRGVGVCVNTLPMLHHSTDGLPVAFAMRAALERPSATEAAGFLRSVPHASGQHYAVVAADAALGLECSARGTADSAAGERFCHTNHALASNDIDASADRPSGTADSRSRLKRLERSAADVASADDCQRLLADREAPLSVHATPDKPWLTFGSVVYELGSRVTARIALGPPDTTAFQEYRLSPA